MPKSPPKAPKRRARQPGAYLAAGRVVRPHGVRGEILAEGAPELMASVVPGGQIFFGSDRRQHDVEAVRTHKDRYLIRLRGVTDREQAEAFRGQEIHIRTSDAPELSPGTYYHWQILGLSVVSDDGENLGRVSRIIETGANDVYVVKAESSKELLIPAIESVVQQVDLDEGTLTVRLIPGLREIQP
jgi:16S rRNA processing protein RimM